MEAVIVTGCGMDDLRVEVRVLVGVRFFLIYVMNISFGPHSSS
jgi:hypothetical protein